MSKKKNTKASAAMARAPASAPSRAASATASLSTATDEPDERVPRRIWVFLGLDLALAALYIGLRSLVHSSDGRFETMTLLMGLCMAGAGVGVAARRPWGWWLSLAGCVAVLLGALALLTLLALSVGFLWGSFGAIGKGAASMSLVFMALIVEVYVLVPAFQLAWLLSPRGRATAGVSTRVAHGA